MAEAPEVRPVAFALGRFDVLAPVVLLADLCAAGDATVVGIYVGVRDIGSYREGGRSGEVHGLRVFIWDLRGVGIWVRMLAGFFVTLTLNI